MKKKTNRSRCWAWFQWFHCARYTKRGWDRNGRDWRALCSAPCVVACSGPALVRRQHFVDELPCGFTNRTAPASGAAVAHPVRFTAARLSEIPTHPHTIGAAATIRESGRGSWWGSPRGRRGRWRRSGWGGGVRSVAVVVDEEVRGSGSGVVDGVGGGQGGHELLDLWHGEGCGFGHEEGSNASDMRRSHRGAGDDVGRGVGR